MWTDRQTDMTKLMAALRNLAKRLKTLKLTNSMKQNPPWETVAELNQMSWSLCKFNDLIARFECMMWRLRSAGMWRCVVTWVLIDVSKKHVIFDAQAVEFDLRCSALQTKALRSFETSDTTDQTTEGYFLQDHLCENLKCLYYVCSSVRS